MHRTFLLLLLGLLLAPSFVPAQSLPGVTGTAVKIGEGVPVMVTVIDDKGADAARRVGGYVSDESLAKQEIVQVTIVNFQSKVKPSMRKITEAQMTLDLKKAASRLDPTYRRLKIGHPPMEDLHAVADFDSKVSESLSVDTASHPVVVLLYDAKGKEVARFNGVPGESQFARYVSPLLP